MDEVEGLQREGKGKGSSFGGLVHLGLQFLFFYHPVILSLTLSVSRASASLFASVIRGRPLATQQNPAVVTTASWKRGLQGVMLELRSCKCNQHLALHPQYFIFCSASSFALHGSMGGCKKKTPDLINFCRDLEDGWSVFELCF